MKNTEIVALTDKELAEKLMSLKAELFNLRLALAGRSLENNMQISVCKRNIARVKTVIRQRELGLAKAPEAAAEKKVAKKSDEAAAEKKATKKSAKVDAEVKG